VREIEALQAHGAARSAQTSRVQQPRAATPKTRGDNLRRTVQTGFDPEARPSVFETEELELEPMPYIVVVVDEFAD